MNLSDYRKYFPITETDIYLNHAAISPFSTKVISAIKAYLEQRTKGSIDVYPQILKERQKLKENYASLINGHTENIAIITSTSEGLNWLANSLTWQPGDEIVLTDYEFPANIYPFLNLQRRGVEIRYIPNRDGKILLDDVRRTISVKTKLLSISFVEFLNGFRNDLKTIGQICKENNIIFSVDGIQGVGAFPFDVQEWQIDFVSNGGHKWLMGPMGCGFMYVAPHLHKQLQPVFAGWLGVKEAWNFLDYRLDFLDDAGRYEIATQNFLGMTGARAATDLLVEIGTARIEAHLLKIGDRLIEGFNEMDYRFIGSDRYKERSGIYSFTGKHSAELFQLLKESRIHVSLRNGAIRVAAHFYNTVDEIEQVLQVSKKFLSRR